jgi:hypothetical protein
MARKPKAATAATPVVTEAPAAPVAAFGAPAIPAGVNVAELQRIVAATKAHPNYTFASLLNCASLETLGLIEINRGITDPQTGNPAVRALFPVADEYLANIGANEAMSKSESPVAAVAGATAVEAPRFELDDNVPIPAIKRGGSLTPRVSPYPFDTMNVGQSFHIAATEDVPNPSKKYASTVSSANARYSFEVKDAAGAVVYENKVSKDENGNPVTTSVPKLDYTKKFVIRSVDASDARGAGARVFRTK